ncbi:hypothetical protein BDY17DRAFT_348972 [Neohortaea acidophila]|uniref:Uncharacterized protein n=1 Tax=Neohortaea acidophila TaxID=245834 RepID=A0A6A6PHZ7_9PEZI|nr:uncharacterized protein BDY17DRAFT_348972 [Neohortaea acidophila]KAF2479416.1 hypothetical protein BDY17DRAFT_348972 [Neohortaea acidophila]
MSLQPGTTQLRTFTRSLLTDGTRTVTTFTEAIWAVATRAPGGGRTTTTIRILVSPSTTSRNIGNGRSSSSTPALTSSSSSSSSTSLTTSASGASNTASSTLQSSHHGFTSGAVAGAAVGCLIAGALIAFLLAFFLFRRKQRKHEASVAAANNYDAYHAPDRKTPLAPVPVALGEKSAATGGTAATGIAAPPASPSWLAYLPPSASDHTIATAVKTFYDQIEQHVDTFYSHSPTSDSSSGAQDAQQSRQPLSEIDSGKLPGRIEDLMQESAMVLPVIKHSIADLLITRLSPLAFAETSLLPPHLAEFPQRLQESPASSPAEAAASQQAYSQWRLLTAYLYPSPESTSAYEDDRDAKTADISSLLASAFAPWQQEQHQKQTKVSSSGDSASSTDSSNDDDEESSLHQHERTLIATAANLGILLMSQAAAFEFRWSPAGAAAAAAEGGVREVGVVVVAPGFWRTTDDSGRGLEAGTAREMVEARVWRS